MSMEFLSLKSLHHVDDGALAIAFDQEIRRLYNDIQDRDGVKDARSLTLTIKLKPKTSQKGEIVEVAAGFSIAATLPKKATEVNMLPSAEGLKFRPTNSENPNQPTLPYESSEDGDE
jgi:hypothetical protein